MVKLLEKKVFIDSVLAVSPKALTISMISLRLLGIEVSACWCRSISACESTNDSSAIFVGRVLKINSNDPAKEGSISFLSRQTVLLISRYLLNDAALPQKRGIALPQ